MSDISKLREMAEKHQEHLQEVRAKTSFENCQTLKQAGELYRELESIEAVADDQDISNEEAEELVAKYISVVNYPTHKCDMLEIARGVRFYGGQESLEELLEEYDASEDEIKLGLRDFVGLTLDENDIEDIDILPSNIPEEAVYPPSVVETTHEAMQSVRKSLSEFEIPTLRLKGLETMSERLSQTFQENLLPLQESFVDLAEQYQSAVSDAIRNGISNFESPEEYDPEEVEVNQLACERAIRSLTEFVENIEEEEAEELYPYLPRLKAIVEGYNEENYYTPTYAAISVQDGLMEWLCERSDKDPTDTNRFDEPFYSWDTKRNILASRYEGWYNVETDEVIPNLESFYQHRNAIMHGDPLAYFDENIATISILFLNLTLYTVINELDDDH